MFEPNSMLGPNRIPFELKDVERKSKSYLESIGAKPLSEGSVRLSLMYEGWRVDFTPGTKGEYYIAAFTKLSDEMARQYNELQASGAPAGERR